MNVRVLSAGLAVAAIMTIAACGGSSGGSTDGAKSGASAASGNKPGANAAAGDSSEPKTIDVCTVLDAKTAAKLSGEPYTQAVSQKGDFASQCAYDDDSSSGIGVNVTIYTGDNVATTWQLVHTGDITDVSGVGDKAMWDKDNTLYAMVGQTLIQVNGLTSEAKSAALAGPIVAALG